MVWIVVLAASYVAIFIAGSALGRHNALSYFTNQTEKWDARVSLGHYTAYRDIAVAIKTASYDRAKCSAQLLASAMLDEVKRCIANNACRGFLEKEAQESAPEALGQAPLPFTHISGSIGQTCK
jgi:hypothetical protein